ncbi:tyrosine-type recombinase/integrase [Pseudonocardia phyllosphaerae]|uniref:tyrosine-type recombinase/integrase n=1 Tax=Pseudonocardia phyllosphaerae TaxID=3390502 RepID=UPI00397BE021
MAAPTAHRTRARGAIEKLASGGFRVTVYAGIDPVSGRRHYVRETVPAGPTAAREARKVQRRITHQIDERRTPRTSATLDQLLDRYLATIDVAATTHRAYTRYLERHVRPFLGRKTAGGVGAEAVDALYAELRRCREHCTGRGRRIDHRTPREHTCDERCRPHECVGLAPATIRHIHFVLNGAFKAGLRWSWVSVNPMDLVTPPAKPPPDPQPPSPAEAALIVSKAWEDPDWGAMVWLFMTTGARRGELCALRWSHIDLDTGTLTIRRAVAQNGRTVVDKDTKTHQQRRLALDDETVEVLQEHRMRWEERFRVLGLGPLSQAAFVFSLAPDGAECRRPGSVSQRYSRLAASVDVVSHLHNLRHYSATELIAAGVDVRTVAGRLGHSGGGVTTLRVYAAWVSEADQRAAAGLGARMPVRPAAETSLERVRRDPRSTREKLAVELLERIESGEVPDGGRLPGVKLLAAEKGIAPSTVHRAFELLWQWGALVGARGQQPRVRRPAAEPEAAVHAAPQLRDARMPGSAATYFTAVVRGPGGLRCAPRVVTGDLNDPTCFREHLLGIARIEDPEHVDEGESWIGRYEIEVAPIASPEAPAVVFRW